MRSSAKAGSTRLQPVLSACNCVMERLERRLLLSVDFDGETLRIVGDERNQTVQIVEQGDLGPPLRVSIDMDGEGSYTGPEDIQLGYANVKAIEIYMVAGDDRVVLSFQSQSVSVTRVHVGLGAGNDSFVMTTAWGGGEQARIYQGNFHLSVSAGAGNDDVKAQFCQVVESDVVISYDMGAGDDTASITFTDRTGGVRAEARMGDGDDKFAVAFTGEHARLVGDVEVSAYGGPGPDTLRAYSAMEPGRTLSGPLHLRLFGELGDDYLSAYFPTWQGDGPDLQMDTSEIGNGHDVPVLLAGSVWYSTTENWFNGLPGTIVYLDEDGDGRRGESERFAVTDSAGRYDLGVYPEGYQYIVRVIVPDGWYADSPAGGAYIVPASGGYVDKDFRLRSTGIAGRVLLANGDNRPAMPAGSVVFIDANGNGSLDSGERNVITDETGQYAFYGLAAGTYTVICIPPEGWEIDGESPDRFTAALASNDIRRADFFIARSTPLTGHVFYDELAGAQSYWPGRGMEGIVVFIDANSNGVLDSGEPQTTTDYVGSFSFGQLPPGTYRVDVVVPDGFTQVEVDWRPTTVTVASNRFTPVVDIALVRSGIGGWVKSWINGRETPVPGVQVYLDLDGDRAYDPGEPLTTTDAQGNYRFSSPPEGTYLVNLLNLDPQWQESQRHSLPVTYVAGRATAEVSFVLDLVPSEVPFTGSVFVDANRNGWQDDPMRAYGPGRPWEGDAEQGIANVIVYVDANGNAARDANEPWTLTDAGGMYAFKGLSADTRSIQIEVPAGWRLFSRSARDFALVQAESPPEDDPTDDPADDPIAPAIDIRGTAGNDTIEVVPVEVMDSGQLVQWFQVFINGTPGDLILPGQSITISGLDGDDLILVDERVPFGVTVYGGEGNDTIIGGSGDDLLFGDAGHDVISGGAGNDTIYGNFGGDTLSGGPGDDQIFGGIGRDSINGGAGNDSLYGGNGMDCIRGGAGDDYIEGKGKADTIYGGAGNDTINSGAGADLAFGQEGDDVIYAFSHILFTDTLHGGPGHDLYEADENDVLIEVEALL